MVMEGLDHWNYPGMVSDLAFYGINLLKTSSGYMRGQEELEMARYGLEGGVQSLGYWKKSKRQYLSTPEPAFVVGA